MTGTLGQKISEIACLVRCSLIVMASIYCQWDKGGSSTTDQKCIDPRSGLDLSCYVLAIRNATVVQIFFFFYNDVHRVKARVSLEAQFIWICGKCIG